jgi:hypothetical protein
MAALLCGDDARQQLEELLAMLNGPCPPIKIENGQLYWWSCCEWQLVGAIDGAVTIDEPWQADDQGQYPEFSACGKAAAIHDSIVAVADGMWDHRDNFPWQWVGGVEGRVPGYNLSNTWIVNGVLEAIRLDIVFGPDDIFDETSLKRVLCRIESIMTADQSGVTSDQFSQIIGFYASEFGALGGGNLYGYAIQALGRGNLSTIAALGATQTNRDCACPSEGDPTSPTASGWYLSAALPDFVVSNGGSDGWASACRVDTPQHDVFGFSFDLEKLGSGQFKCMGASTVGNCDTYNVSCFKDSNALGFGVRITNGATTALDEIYGSGNYSSPDISDVFGSGNPASPDVLAGNVIAMGHQYGFNIAGQGTVKNFRWLYNVNSPSHAS